MSLFRALIFVLVSLSLLSCSSEEGPSEPPRLLSSQKTMVSESAQSFEKIEQVLNAFVFSPDKDIESDLTDIIEHLSSCRVKDNNKGTVGGGYYVGKITLRSKTNERCPVQFEKEFQYKLNKNKNGYQLFSGSHQLNYKVIDKEILQVLDIKSANIDVDYFKDGSYALRASINSLSTGDIRLNDRLIITKASGIHDHVFTRNVYLKDFLAKAVVSIKIDRASNEIIPPIQIKLNGEELSAEEMTSIYPRPFDWFTNGQKFSVPIPEQN